MNRSLWQDTVLGAAILAFYHQFQNSEKAGDRMGAYARAPGSGGPGERLGKGNREGKVKTEAITPGFAADLAGVDVRSCRRD